MFSKANNVFTFQTPCFSSFGAYIVLFLMVALSGCEDKGTATSRSTRSSQNISVVSYGGGAYQESHKKAFIEPFHNYTGIDVRSIVWGADYGKLKAMVHSGQVTWDVVEVTAAQFKRGQNDNLFSKLTVKPDDGVFLPDTISEYGVANVYWGTVMAFRKEAFPKAPPKTWEDFFDVTNFPGSRALYDDPRANLEFALLADGVKPDDLYPLDVDRAFKKLNTIKDHVRVWWKGGTQPIQLLLSGEADLSSVWNGRIFASNDARKQIGYSWSGAALELDYWVIPKGSGNRDISSRFIVHASSPYAMAKQAEIVGYGPVNISALDLINPDIQTHLPTYKANWDRSFAVDSQWWSENEETIKTRWLAWKIK